MTRDEFYEKRNAINDEFYDDMNKLGIPGEVCYIIVSYVEDCISLREEALEGFDNDRGKNHD